MLDIVVQLDYIARIALASICGMLIGYERAIRSKEAGLKTHVIVSMGSALMMIVSKYGFFDVADYDASRVAAQIVSGVGFLGAGIIFVRRRSVSGLTTAAGIWATAGVGMCIGAGMYVLGIGACILLVIIQLITHYSKIPLHQSATSVMLMDVTDLNNVFEIQKLLESYKIKLNDMKIERTENGYGVELFVQTDSEEYLRQFLNEVQKKSGIHKVYL